MLDAGLLDGAAEDQAAGGCHGGGRPPCPLPGDHLRLLRSEGLFTMKVYVHSQNEALRAAGVTLTGAFRSASFADEAAARDGRWFDHGHPHEEGGMTTYEPEVVRGWSDQDLEALRGECVTVEREQCSRSPV